MQSKKLIKWYDWLGKKICREKILSPAGHIAKFIFRFVLRKKFRQMEIVI